MKYSFLILLGLISLNSFALTKKDFIDEYRKHLAPTADSANCIDENKCFSLAHDYKDRNDLEEAYIYFSKARLLGQPNGCAKANRMKGKCGNLETCFDKLRYKPIQEI